MKPRDCNIDSFCSKISESNLKGLVKIPCEHKCHTTYRSGSRSGHERSPESKNPFLACGTLFIVTFARIIQKLMLFCNLKPCKSKTETCQVNPGSYNVKLSNWYFRIIYVCFWTSLISGFQKCHFCLYAMSRNARNRSLKNDVING